MTKTTVHVEGAAELAAALSEPLREDAADAVERAVARIRDRVKPLVPARRGVLRASVKGYVYRSQLGGMVTSGGKGAKHAHLIELGVKPHSIVAGKKTRKSNKRALKRGRETTVAKRALLLPGGILRASAHPQGFGGKFFMKRGLEEARPQVEGDLARIGVEITTSFAKFEKRRGRRKR